MKDLPQTHNTTEILALVIYTYVRAPQESPTSESCTWMKAHTLLEGELSIR